MDYLLGQVCMFSTVLDMFCWSKCADLPRGFSSVMKEAFTHDIIEVCKNTRGEDAAAVNIYDFFSPFHSQTDLLQYKIKPIYTVNALFKVSLCILSVCTVLLYFQFKSEFYLLSCSFIAEPVKHWCPLICYSPA